MMMSKDDIPVLIRYQAELISNMTASVRSIQSYEIKEYTLDVIKAADRVKALAEALYALDQKGS